MPQQYALVSRSKPLRLPSDEAIDDDQQQHLNGDDPLRHELAAIYQSFAELYPSPRLVEEMQEREKLWAAALAADTARRAASQVDSPFLEATSTSPQRGFLSRWLFGKGSTQQQPHSTIAAAAASSTLQVDEVLEFIEEEGDETTLCGTQFSLDPTCIPQEAYARARFHAACAFRRHQPNLVRHHATTNGSSKKRSTTFTLVITGLGSILEFQPRSTDRTLHDGDDDQDDTTDEDYVAHVKHTADRDDLHDFMTEASVTFDLSHARGAMVGEHLLAISWGLMDGVVVLYRRMEFPKLPTVGWEPVAVASPAPAVIRNMVGSDDFLHEESETNLLRVTDILPLVVDDGPVAVGRPPAAACLAIGRLGGYIELVPLALSLWWGPTLTPSNHKRPSASRKRKRKRRPNDPIEHYAVGKLVDVSATTSSVPAVVALTTCDYHADLMCLQVYRTTVSVDTEWDKTAFSSPPAQFVLSACGGRDGRETMTFWAVSTMFAVEDGNKNQGIEFSIHAILLEAIDIGPVGADIAIFANDTIMKHWRKPRQVELKATASSTASHTMREEEDRNKSTHRLTTISMSAPVVAMRFDTTSHHDDDDDGSNHVLLAVLDWNGGVCILDCSRVARLAAHTLSSQEFESIHHQAEDADPIPLVTMLCTRSKLKKVLPSTHNMDVDWLPVRGPEAFGVDARLVVVSKDSMAALQTLDIKTVGSKPTLIRSSFVEMPSHLWIAFTEHLNSVDALSFVSRKRHKKTNAFFLCSMQTVEPRSIVDSLFRSGKFMEAIDATKGVSLSEDILNVIDLCHKHLWEQTREVHHLESIADDAFVVEQALSLLETENSGEQIDIETVRRACLQALSRAEGARLALALKLGGSDGTTTVSKLRRATIMIGTYLLLCRHLQVTGTYHSFQMDFCGVSLVSLALAFARNADISALTVLVVRHKKEIAFDLFDIIQSIPITVSPTSFLHLLPVISKSQEVQVMLVDGKISRLAIAELPAFMFKSVGLAVVVDANDEQIVLEENAKECDDDRYASFTAAFYASRARQAHEFLGDLEAFIELCEIGLQAFGLDPTIHSRDSFELVPSMAKDLYQDCLCAISLFRATLEVGDPTQRRIASRDHVQIDDLRRMSVDEITSLILDGVSSVQVAAAIQNHVRPLLRTVTGTRSSEAIDETLEDAIVSYCSHLTEPRRSREASKDDGGLWVLRTKLAICLSIARASSTSKRRKDRIVKDKRKLTKLVLSAVLQGTRALDDIRIKAEPCNDIVETMWGMFESLPSQIPATETSDNSFLSMHATIDALFRVLVGVDIVLRWPGCSVVASLASLLNLTDCNGQKNNNHETEKVGLRIVSELCRCFSSQVGNENVDGKEKKLELARDFISDVKELDVNSFNGALTISTVTDKILVKPLLLAKQFHVIGELISCSPKQWFDRSQLISSVQLYVSEAIAQTERESSSRARDPSVHSVIACQDILGPLLPELHSEFQSIRRELDALDFIETVALRDYKGCKSFDLSELKTKFPMDVVETILSLNPRCIIHNCTEWANHSFASQTNARIRERANVSGSFGVPPDEDPPLPLLPGGAVFQLATILGLDDPPSVIVVKSRVVHYCLVGGFHGAAAATCRTLLDPNVTIEYCGPSDVLRLSAAAEVIGSDTYLDTETKFELCRLVLKLFRGNVPYFMRGDFDTVFSSFRSLEQENMEKAARKRGDWVVDRIYYDIKAQYSTDIHELFSTLAMNASSCVVDNSLINALCRFVIFWCIADCTNARAHDSSQTSYVREQLALGASLLLHIQQTPVALSNIEEFREILSTQMSSHRDKPERAKQYDAVTFDPSVVKKLRGRGYSENGARRAAIMAKNDFDRALAWAVSHSLDPSFDEPIVILKSKSLVAAVDRAGALLVEETLAYAQKLMKGSVPMLALKPGPSSPLIPQISVDAGHKGREMPSTRNEKSHSDELHLKGGMKANVRKMDIAPKVTKTVKAATAVRKLSTPSEVRQNGQPSKLAASASNGTVREQTTFTHQKPSAVARIEPELDRARHASTSHDQGADTRQKSSSSMDSSLDRAVLRQQGQVVRQQAQNVGANIISSEERRRLIEQGRRLLQKAREARHSAPGTPTNEVPTPPASAGDLSATQSDVLRGSVDATTPTANRTAPASAPANLNQTNGRQNTSSLDRDYHDSKNGNGEEEGWDWDI